MVLDFFGRYFKSNKIHDETILNTLETKHHVASGIFFTNGTHMLAGYQPKKQTPRITGIGGMKNNNETLLYTAIRECIEELFNPPNISSDLIHKIMKNVKPKDCYMTGTYGVIVYSFTDLEHILNIVKKAKLITNTYAKLPLTLEELVFQRKHDAVNEIVSLCLLPIEEYSTKYYILHKELIMDMKIFIERKRNI